VCPFRNCVEQDCKISQWTEWDECSVDCGGGQQGRTREVIQMPSYLGKPCSDVVDSDYHHALAHTDENTNRRQLGGFFNFGDGETSRMSSDSLSAAKQIIHLSELRGCNPQQCAKNVD
jgi:hypothetical protein